MKKIIVLVLLSCCTFLFANEKVVIEREADSEIQSITVEKDVLIIKSKGKTYTFKFSEILKDKSVKATAKVPKNLEEAFAVNGKWFFFNAPRNKRNRFCYLNNKKEAYKVFSEGTLFKRVLYKTKYYARDLNKIIYRPDWEMKTDFSPHLIPAGQYIYALNNAIRTLQRKITAMELEIPLAIAQFNTAQKHYNIFLTVNNITIKKIDKRSNIIIKESNGKYDRKIKKELKLMHQNLEKQKDNMEKLILSLNSSEAEMQKLLKLKEKVDFLYKKHVLKQDVIRPLNIHFLK